MLPDITVIIITYKRPNEVRKCLNALRGNLIYNGKIKYLIADDSSGGSYLLDLARDYPDIAVSSTPRNVGWGANANHHIDLIDTQNYFLCEDDQILSRKLDLNPGVALLELNPDVGMIRYGGIAGHLGMMLEIKEFDVTSLAPNFEQGLMYVSRYHYAEIKPVGGGIAAFSYSNRPHLTHKRWHEAYGYYIEGYRLGDTEFNYTMRFRDELNANPSLPKIVVPIDWLTNHWHDVGISYQGSVHDKGKSIFEA